MAHSNSTRRATSPRSNHPSRSASYQQVHLKLVDVDSVEYKEVKKILKGGWKHSDRNRPKVQRVFKIMCPLDMLLPYLKHRENILADLQTKEGAQANVQNGNEHLLFHGTTRACLVGEDPSRMTLCTLPMCSLCNIMRNSYDVKLCGAKRRFTRFGKAIYTTSCSSKADDYCANLHADASSRVLLLNRVLAGREFRTKYNSTHLIRPPNGYHSVLGEPGVHLNYEEAAVYTNDAIRPAYLVVYDYQTGFKLKNLLRRICFMPIV